ncbi:MAG: GGDEF domain-containing protein [Paracoccaceae bacterium]|nr:GGDEF domain-containing protein [Paracoccaceae bacterium]
MDDLASKSDDGAPPTVMIADLDHFKSVNDRYGHHAGDQVLREIACRLQNNLRSVDLVARYGERSS